MAPPNAALLNAGHASTWQNLGDWSSATEYPDAARQLALRLGQAIQLSPKDRLIDVGCGSGDQLRVWHEDFGVSAIVGYEPHAPSVLQARIYAEDRPAITVVRGTDAAIGAPAPSAILSLDAAYHFRSRAGFLQRAGRLLPPGGRIGLTDLIAPGPRPDIRSRLLALLAGIPQRNLWDAARWPEELRAAGFDSIELVDLTQPVLAGFARFAQVHFGGPPVWRSLDRLKIALTGWTAGHAARRSWLGYALITAVRADLPTAMSPAYR